MSVLIVFFTTVLLLLSAFVVLIILMQKPSANAGMGSALGGGAAEQAFGGDAANVLTRTTVYTIIGFFVLAFLLYLGNLSVAKPSESRDTGSELQSIASGLVAEQTEETTTEPPAAETPVVEDGVEAVSLDDLEEQAPEPAAEEAQPETPKE